MKAWTHRRSFVAGALLVVATNAIVLAGVAYNRSGEPESRLLLTQRELSPTHTPGEAREAHGMSLRLQWRVLPPDARGPHFSFSGGGEPHWLDAAKLAALGFDVSVPPHVLHARLHYQRQLPREALLVLEMDGPAHAQALARARRHAEDEAKGASENEPRAQASRRQSARAALEREEFTASRLFAVDAGLDREALRATYPDTTRYAIVRGQVRIHARPEQDAGTLGGSVSAIGNTEINVPKAFLDALDRPALWPPGQRDTVMPPVRMHVAFGRRLEPWLAAVEAGTEAAARDSASRPAGKGAQ